MITKTINSNYNNKYNKNEYKYNNYNNKSTLKFSSLLSHMICQTC